MSDWALDNERRLNDRLLAMTCLFEEALQKILKITVQPTVRKLIQEALAEAESIRLGECSK